LQPVETPHFNVSQEFPTSSDPGGHFGRHFKAIFASATAQRAFALYSLHVNGGEVAKTLVVMSRTEGSILLIYSRFGLFKW
jgi:hypothetical protein